MIRIKLTSIAVDDQDKADAFYVGKLGFQVKQNIAMNGPIRYLTVVSPAEPDGVELSIEPGGHMPEFAAFQALMREKGIPWTPFAVDDIDAEHARLTAEGVEVTVGDAYVQLGRGLVLSMRKVDELGVDDVEVRGDLVEDPHERLRVDGLPVDGYAFGD